jgi:hypothetical protein
MMPAVHISDRVLRHAILLLMALALLFAQRAGLNHGIAHPLKQQSQAVGACAEGTACGDREHTTHSCAAFDAATVADAIHVGPSSTPAADSPQMLALWVAFTSWDAPVVPSFSPRAPPLV